MRYSEIIKELSSYKDFLTSSQLYVGVGYPPYRGMQARQIAEYELDRRNFLISTLKNSHAANFLKVFGSATGMVDVPGDIDCFIDLSEAKIKGLSTELMKICKEYWPLFDPFVLSKGQLYSHSESSNANSISWTIVKHHKKAIEQAGKHGVPVLDFHTYYKLPD